MGATMRNRFISYEATRDRGAFGWSGVMLSGAAFQAERRISQPLQPVPREIPRFKRESAGIHRRSFLTANLLTVRALRPGCRLYALPPACLRVFAWRPQPAFAC